MSDEYFVDDSRCLTAFTERAPRTRADLFAIETFDNISDRFITKLSRMTAI